LWLVGEIENVHEGAGGGGGAGDPLAPACATLKARPAMVSEPDREAPVFAATLNVTEPFPVPVEPDVTVIHDAWLLAVHPHRLCTDTATVPPVAATF
jgi:hypothetical protein